MKKEIQYLKKYYKGDLDVGIKKLKNGEPVQYIVGNVNFYGYEIDINKDVLIPRRETEELVEKVIKRSSAFIKPKILDIGTGSGAIAISISKELNTLVYASDISGRALEIAQNNSNKNNANVEFLQGDMLKPYIDNNIKIDIIISNPPYIKKNEEIEKIVYDNEPHLALFANNNGLEFYESILRDAKKVLNNKFLIAFEIGETQANDIKNIAQKYFNNIKIDVEKDLSLKDRFIFVYNY